MKFVLSMFLLVIASSVEAQTLKAQIGEAEPLIHIEAWGNIRVIGSGPGSLSVSLTPTANGPTATDHARDHFGLKTTGARAFVWSDESGDIDVVVPARSRLVIRSYRWGDVEVRDVCGDIEVTSFEGGVNLQRVGGAVVAHAGNGPVRAELAWSTPRPSSLTSMHGAIRITIPRGLRILPRLRTEEGAIESVIPWQDGLRPPSSRADQVQLFAYTRFGPIDITHNNQSGRCR